MVLDVSRGMLDTTILYIGGVRIRPNPHGRSAPGRKMKDQELLEFNPGSKLSNKDEST